MNFTKEETGDLIDWLSELRDATGPDEKPDGLLARLKAYRRAFEGKRVHELVRDGATCSRCGVVLDDVDEIFCKDWIGDRPAGPIYCCECA
jgi:hypothetical protein